jgi:hypothetical protein
MNYGNPKTKQGYKVKRAMLLNMLESAHLKGDETKVIQLEEELSKVDKFLYGYDKFREPNVPESVRERMDYINK